MRKYTRMLLLGRQEKHQDRESYYERSHPYPQNPEDRRIGMARADGDWDIDYRRPMRRDEYGRRFPPIYGEDAPEDRFRDRKGREHYDNGRYAPKSYDDGPQMGDRHREDWEYPEHERRMIEPIRHHYDGWEEDEGEHERPMIGFARDGDYEGRTREKKFDKSLAQKWMDHIENADGTTGAHWSMEQAKSVMAQHKIDADPTVFWVVLNMIYSDDSAVAKEFGVNTIDYYAKMAKAFIEDKDALPIKERLANYYEYIVRH